MHQPGVFLFLITCLAVSADDSGIEHDSIHWYRALDRVFMGSQQQPALE